MLSLKELFKDFPIVTDGAWGTELQQRGLLPGELADLWNLTHPAHVEAVARAYVAAGSQVILTNTFRSNLVSLADHHAADRVVEINRRGVELSRAAAGDGLKVFASIGPTGKLITTGDIEPETALAAFRAQAQALAAGGPDALLFETFSDLEEARVAIRAGRETGLPVLISFAFDSGKKRDRTMMGSTPEQAAKVAVEEGADAVGANCGAGPDAFIDVCRRLVEASGLPVWIKPNAGLPVMEGGKAVYSMSPAEFATYVPALRGAGASFIGGCCGTSPAYVQALVKGLSA